jgi:hypothetical protein
MKNHFNDEISFKVDPLVAKYSSLNDKKVKLYTVIFLLIVIVISFFFPRVLSVLFFILPWFAFYFIFKYFNLEKTIRNTVMEKIAKSKNLTYEKNGFVEIEGSIIANYGGYHDFSNILSSAETEGTSLKFFTYKSSTVSGEKSDSCTYTVFERNFKSPVPHLYFCKKNALAYPGEGFVSVAFGGDFGSKFNVYVQSDHELETHSIFTPECTREILSNDYITGGEFFNNRVFLLNENAPETEEDIVLCFESFKKISSMFIPSINAMKGDLLAMKDIYSSKSN